MRCGSRRWRGPRRRARWSGWSATPPSCGVGRAREEGGPGGEAAAPAAPDVVALLRYLRAELGRAGLSAASSVYASEVRPEIWAVAEERTESAGNASVAHISDDDTARLELSVRRTGASDVAVAVEDGGVNVFLGPDELTRHTGGRAPRAGAVLRFAEEVEIHAFEPPRAERLGVEDRHPQRHRGGSRGMELALIIGGSVIAGLVDRFRGLGHQYTSR